MCKRIQTLGTPFNNHFMKRNIFLILLVVFSISVHAQGTAADFTKKIFGYFKNDQMDSIYSTIPTFEELTSLAIASGIDPESEQYKVFVIHYPEIMEDFKLKCQKLRSSNRQLKFEWKDAEIENVVEEEVDVPVHDDKTKDDKITIVKAKLYFTANNKHFIMNFGDLKIFGPEWKMGYNIEIYPK